MATVVGAYVEAAALDFDGVPYGLPPALSGRNGFDVWAPRGPHPRHRSRLRDDLAALRPSCRSMHTFAQSVARYATACE